MALTVKQLDPSEINLQPLVVANQQAIDQKNQAASALAASVAKELEEILNGMNDQTSGQTSGGKAQSSATQLSLGSPPSAGGPSSATMQNAMGQLAFLLGQLLETMAQFSQTTEQLNSQVGEQLSNAMAAQVKQAQNELQKIVNEESHQSFWSIFTRVAEAIVGAAVAAISLLCGQPELAAIALVMTVLTVSGGMQEGSQLISSLFQSMGLSEDLSNLLASVTLIAASIAVTAVTCGGAAGTAAEAAANPIADGVETGLNDSDSFIQRVQNFFSKVGEYIKTKNPFNSLSKGTNLVITAAAGTAGTSGFGQDLATLSLSKLPQGKLQSDLTTLIESVTNLLAALAGAGAGMAICATPSATQLSNLTTLFKLVMAGEAAGNAAQIAGQTGLAVTQFQWASSTEALGQADALAGLYRSLVTMVNRQMQSGLKAAGDMMSSTAQEITAFLQNVDAYSKAVTQVVT